MKKVVRVVLSPEAEQTYDYLEEWTSRSRPERVILNGIIRKKELIKSNPHYGDPVAKHLIPQEYIQKYGITNLFRVELPLFWRFLYTLTKGKDENEMVAFVLDIMNHPQYDKKFGYRKR